MAESFMRYKGWMTEFEVSEFALIWLVIETVLDADSIREDPSSLQGRLQRLIETDCLDEVWYHSTTLDPIIGSDEKEFQHVLANALWLVRTTFWQGGNLWLLLKRPNVAVKVAAVSMFEDPTKLGTFLGALMRFALPAIMPRGENDVMCSLSWNQVDKPEITTSDTAVRGPWQPGLTWRGRGQHGEAGENEP